MNLRANRYNGYTGTKMTTRRLWTLWMLMLLPCCNVSKSNAQVLSVCQSGCSYTSVQAAVDSAQEGSVVEVEAGHTFTENLVIVDKKNIEIRSSRWRDLPAEGYRIDPGKHAGLLATIQTNNTQPAMEIGAAEHSVSQGGVDLAADTITFNYAEPRFQFANGMAVSCVALGEYGVVLPAPLVAGRKYWVRDWQRLGSGPFQGRFADTPDGPPIDLTSPGSSGAAYYYSRPRCQRWSQPTGIRITGIRFAIGGPTAPRQLVQIGHNLEVDPVRMGPNVELRHVVITGRKDDFTGPLFCLALFGGANHIVQDSWIGHCKSEGDESKGVSIQNTVGARIKNNYISAASINVLTAGGDAASMDVNRNIAVTGNFLEKQGYMFYKEGTGAPTGECYYGGGSGAFYRRTDVTPNTCANGACYTCGTDNAWQLDTGAYYRARNYLTKNLLEFKDCEDCTIEGNRMRGSYGGPDAGQGWCFGLAVIVTGVGTIGGGSPYHRAHNVTIRNNWADYCYSGVSLTHSSYDGVIHAQVPLKNILIENNLFTEMGWFPALTQWPTADGILRWGVKQALGSDGIRIVNNTLRAHDDYKIGMLAYPAAYPDRTMRHYQFDNNLMSYTEFPFFVESARFACASDGLFQFFPNDGASRLRSNVFFGGDPSSPVAYLSSNSCRPLVDKVAFEQTAGQVGFASASDHRLDPASPYSARNSAAAFVSADTLTDVGADVDVVEQFATAAEQGVPPMPEELQVTVVPGSREAEIRFRRPENATCQVTLYSKKARIPANELTDTNSAARKQDSRSSSVVTGSMVHFVAGTVSPLIPRRPYWYKIDCGSRWAIGQFQTSAAGVGGRFEPTFRNAGAASVHIEYSPTSDFASFASTTAGFTGGTASVAVALPSGVHYWRSRLLDSGQHVIETSPVHVFVAP